MRSSGTPLSRASCAAQRLAGGDDVRGRARGRASASSAGCAPSSTRGGCARSAARSPSVAQASGGEPAVGRAVRVDDVDLAAIRGEPARAAPAGRADACCAIGSRTTGMPIALGRRRDRRLGRRDQRHAMAAVEEAARLGEDADLLPAPAAGVLGVDDRQRLHRGVVALTGLPSRCALRCSPLGRPVGLTARTPARSGRTSARGSAAPTAASRGSCAPTCARRGAARSSSGRRRPRRAMPPRPQRRGDVVLQFPGEPAIERHHEPLLGAVDDFAPAGSARPAPSAPPCARCRRS